MACHVAIEGIALGRVRQALRALVQAIEGRQLEARVVGLACLRLLPCLCDPLPYAELTELVVDPGYRRQGVGRCLVQYIEREARAQGAVTLTLMTAWQNTGAHAFYQALGYNLYTICMQRSLLDIEQSPT